MSGMPAINNKTYWDNRFQSDWDARQGPEQSRFFARLAIEMLPVWLRHELLNDGLIVCDWGCAEGDGTAVLAELIGSEKIVGIDFSDVAVQTARHRYPLIRFECDDLQTAERQFDVVFTSNVLEHFTRPFNVLANVGQCAARYLIALVPFAEETLIPEHLFRFTYDNIPTAIGGWTLRAAQVKDAGDCENTHWSGEQVLLVYGKATRTCPDALRLSNFGRPPRADRTIVKQIRQLQGLERAIGRKETELECSERALDERVDEIEKRERAADERADEIEKREREAEELQAACGRLQSELGDKQQRLRELADGFLSQVERARLSRTYKASRVLSAIKHRPWLGAKRCLRWSLEKYRSTGRGLTTLLNAPDPLEPLQRELETFRGDGNRHADTARLSDQAAPRTDGTVLIFAGVPYDDIGGGQRSAQLARCLLRRLHAVTYLYAFPRVDIASGRQIHPQVDLPRLRHDFVQNVAADDLFRHLPKDTVCIFELPHPDFLPFLQKALQCGVRTVFELIDDWDSSLGSDWYSDDVLKQFVELADTSVGTAKRLVERLSRECECAPEYVPNAADESVFDAYRTEKRPDDYPGGFDETVLYFGSMYGEWFAWDYLRHAAAVNPKVGFVMIGDKPPKVGRLPENVVFLGPKQNIQLPGYLRAADAAMIPFLPGKITRAVSPIKVFEYLFLSKPVITTDMEEIRGYPGVSQATSADEFARLCGRLPSPPPDMDRFISMNNWNHRVDVLLQRRPPDCKFSFIILIHNNAGIIRRLLATLMAHTKGFDAEYIVVDNCSTDAGPELVRSRFPNVKLVRNPVNGCASGRNLGVAHATGDCFVFFDSDMWFTSSAWLHEAALILANNAQVGAVGWAGGWFDASSDYLAGPTADSLPDRGANGETERFGYRSDVAYLGTGGMFVPRHVWESIDGFDEFYDPTVLEDADLALQIKHRGFELAFRDLTGIRHQPHQTTNASGRSKAYLQLLQRNSDYFKMKWAQYAQWWSNG